MAVYNGTSSADYYPGTAGSDSIYGFGGADNLLGGDGADYIDGGDGNDNVLDFDAYGPDLYSDTLSGGGGNDFIYGGYLDNIYGGSGTDTLIIRLDYAPTGIVFDFTALWTGATYTLAGATIQGIEKLQYCAGSAYSDILTTGTPAGQIAEIRGMGGSDLLTGGAGTDYLAGYSGVGPFGVGYDTSYDELYGLGGNDFLSCGIGDYVDGGSGTDRLSLELNTSGTGITIDFTTLLTSGSDTILGSTFISLEDIGNIMGSSGNDTIYAWADPTATFLYGRDGNDTLITGNGNDILDGGTGADALSGGGGDDEYRVDNLGDTIVENGGRDTVVTTISWTLGSDLEILNLESTGGAINGTGNGLANIMNANSSANVLNGAGGDDWLSGQDGNDVLIGGTGRDDLIGGSGADRYVFDDGEMAGTSWSTTDRIFNFNSAEGDRIDLSGIDAVTGGADNAFAFIGTAAFSGVAGQLRYDTGGVIYGDLNGDALADFAIGFNTAVTLTGTDFFL